MSLYSPFEANFEIEKPRRGPCPALYMYALVRGRGQVPFFFFYEGGVRFPVSGSGDPGVTAVKPAPGEYMYLTTNSAANLLNRYIKCG